MPEPADYSGAKPTECEAPCKLFKVVPHLDRNEATLHNPRHKAYSNYGGRGISVCAEWLDFTSFQSWALENGYNDSASIDRIDNDGAYTPQNCRWVSSEVQANNRRSNHMVEYGGKSMTLAEFCKENSSETLSASAIRQRIKNGHTPAEAISKPARIIKRGEQK